MSKKLLIFRVQTAKQAPKIIHPKPKSTSLVDSAAKKPIATPTAPAIVQKNITSSKIGSPVVPPSNRKPVSLALPTIVCLLTKYLFDILVVVAAPELVTTAQRQGPDVCHRSPDTSPGPDGGCTSTSPCPVRRVVCSPHRYLSIGQVVVVVQLDRNPARERARRNRKGHFAGGASPRGTTSIVYFYSNNVVGCS